MVVAGHRALRLQSLVERPVVQAAGQPVPLREDRDLGRVVGRAPVGANVVVRRERAVGGSDSQGEDDERQLSRPRAARDGGQAQVGPDDPEPRHGHPRRRVGEGGVRQQHVEHGDDRALRPGVEEGERRDERDAAGLPDVEEPAAPRVPHEPLDRHEEQQGRGQADGGREHGDGDRVRVPGGEPRVRGDQHRDPEAQQHPRAGVPHPVADLLVVAGQWAHAGDIGPAAGGVEPAGAPSPGRPSRQPCRSRTATSVAQ